MSEYEEEIGRNVDFIQREFARLQHQNEVLKADTLVDTSLGPEGSILVPEWVRIKPKGKREIDYFAGLDDLFPALSPCAGTTLLPLSHTFTSSSSSLCAPASSMELDSQLASCIFSLNDSMMVSPCLAPCHRANSLLSPSTPRCALQSFFLKASCPIAAALPRPIFPALASSPSSDLAATCCPITHLSVFPLSNLSAILASSTPPHTPSSQTEKTRAWLQKFPSPSPIPKEETSSLKSLFATASKRVSSDILAEALEAERQKPMMPIGVKITSALLARRLLEAGRPNKVHRPPQAWNQLSYSLRLAMALDASLYE